MNSTLTHPKAILLSAGIGGAAPTLIDLAQVLTSKLPWIPGPAYYGGIMIFFVLGASVAWIFGETDSRKAFFLGVSLPALIATLQTEPDGGIPTQHASVPKAALLQFIPSAHAQGQPTQTERQHDGESNEPQLTLQFFSMCPNCQLWLYDSSGKFLQTEPIPENSDVHAFGLPPDTAIFGVWNGQINPKLWSLPEDQSSWHYELMLRKNAWNELLRGLGNYNKKPYDIHVTPSDGSG